MFVYIKALYALFFENVKKYKIQHEKFKIQLQTITIQTDRLTMKRKCKIYIQPYQLKKDENDKEYTQKKNKKAIK